MDVRTFFVADAESAELMQPRYRTFNDPTRCTQAAAMRFAAASDNGLDFTLLELHSMRIGVVTSIRLHYVGFGFGAANFTGHVGDGVHHRNKFCQIVSVCTGQMRNERNTLRICQKMMLAAKLRSIRGIGTRFFPPHTARTDPESTMARDQSIRSAERSSASNVSCSCRHTPASCHSANRRQHVMPEPHPISCGSISQGIPVFMTNRIPVSTARSSRRGLPPSGLEGTAGKRGETFVHSSSVTSCFMSISLKADALVSSTPN